VRIVGVQVSEPFLRYPEIQARFAALAEVARAKGRLRHQLLLSLGEFQGPWSDGIMARMLAVHADSAEERQAVLSGLREGELRFLRRLLSLEEWRAERPGRARVFVLLARAIVNEGKSARIEALLEHIALGEVVWQRAALAEGVLAACPRTPTGEPGCLRSSREPRAYVALTKLAELSSLTAALVWPSKPGYTEEEPVRPLTEGESLLFERGQELYTQTCVQCHQSSGRGEPGKAPSLRHSPFVLGSPARLVAILMHGLLGPIEVMGQKWDAEMPAFVARDEDTAAIATFIRREWGHGADPLSVEFVERFREAQRERKQPWTAEELAASF
jgi:mono/diheme cytochrome c family protein